MDNTSISSGAMDAGFGPLRLLSVIVIITIFAAVFIFKPLLSNRALEEFYESQPCPSRKQQRFSWLRATLRSFTDTSDCVEEGYTKYSKFNIPFLVPNIRKGPILALPPSQLKAVFGNPEHRLAAHVPQFENVSAQYTMRDPAIYPSNYEVDVVQKQITRKYGTVTNELAEELLLAFGEYWGTAEEWHDVLAWDSLQKIAARGVNRVAVGLPLCRDKNFLERTRRYAMSIPRDGFLIGLIPSFLKPLLAPLITWPGRNDCNAGIDACIPLVQERLQKYQKKADPCYDRPPPNDVLQWIIEESNASGDPEQMKPRRIAHRLVMYNFNSVPPIGLTLAHLLLDLYSGPNAEEHVTRLREESRDVLASSPDGTWTKATVSKLVLADSTIRESMRMSDFGSLALPRRVSTPDGIELDGGIKVPKGVQIEVPMHSIHMDDGFYRGAAQFQPFRFADGSGPRKKDGTGQQRSAVTIDETFLGFGFGRNGCPGRFFGTHIMKVMLAYIVDKYDLEFMSKRPPVWTLMELRILPESTTLKIRRKKQN